MSLVDDIFGRVKFDGTDINVHNAAYDAVKEIAGVMCAAAPPCAEVTLALRALHLALMHFGTALAKSDKYKSSEHTLTPEEMPGAPHPM
jgi:hypothetical protein